MVPTCTWRISWTICRSLPVDTTRRLIFIVEGTPLLSIVSPPSATRRRRIALRYAWPRCFLPRTRPPIWHWNPTWTVHRKRTTSSISRRPRWKDRFRAQKMNISSFSIFFIKFCIFFSNCVVVSWSFNISILSGESSLFVFGFSMKLIFATVGVWDDFMGSVIVVGPSSNRHNRMTLLFVDLSICFVCLFWSDLDFVRSVYTTRWSCWMTGDCVGWNIVFAIARVVKNGSSGV